MYIDKLPIKYNYSSRNGVVPKFIVVHDTGNKSSTADAHNHYKYFNGGNRNASAHYFVDDKGVVETVEVSLSAWHCGDGKGKYGITNSNSIGVELCINEGSDFEKTKSNALELIRFLMSTYNIGKNNVARHYDASRKNCPRSMSKNNWNDWWVFRELI
ncbi:N-acetylmuramoyl-L-alanine amidase [Anaerosphaera aminiphila DSM 21120]|uniref:N-acetylmuramoyl-L-alanine amidase n=1 Tax=Anaerosphaera aminiphila DSM 21120 TaxID=1120995 RepID=A0A1M5TT61_9FIRM|nr:N-acetylmuramoyl-L-alanine amidase [Anaerosphaera aminiphila]SHH53899.1 N-acetylmuramoyl-L-alanine amidase [Anaerosphaera aminiphila DSM 21120]